jgi:tetratricopeptide (TPR) repeat protein
MLKRAIQLAPQNGFILDSLGWIYYKMHKFKKAAEIFERANKLAPNQPVILEHMADNFYKMGEKKLALDLYQKIMRFSLEPNDEAENNPTETSSVKERVREKIALIADSTVR